MKIGIYSQPIRGAKTGLGIYTEAIVTGLKQENGHAHRFFFYEKSADRDWNTFERLYWENVELVRRASKDRVDLLHVPAFAPPWLKSFRLVVTVHDLIGMILPNQIGLPSQWYWGHWLPYAVKKADAMIVSSENTKKDVLRYLAVPEKKIQVIYPSGHERFRPLRNGKTSAGLKKKLGIREYYFLSVGTLEPRKNLKRVLEAFGEFSRKKREARYQLVLVGSKDFAHGKVFRELAHHIVLPPDDVIFTGYLEQGDLNALYSGARAFLFPSLYEGFGIPILEAMASGAPVMTSNLSSLPEVAGTAAYFVNPHRTQEILEAMNVFAENDNMRQDFAEKGFQQIKKFSWKQTVSQTLKVYESLE